MNTTSLAQRLHRGLIPAAILSLALVPAACAPADTAEGDEMAMESPADDAMTRSTPVTLTTANFTAAGAATGTIGGTVTVRETSPHEAPEFTVRVTGLRPGEHAWHIHEGACGNAGPVIYAFSSTADMEGEAGNLNANDSGVAQTTARAPRIDHSIFGAGTHSLHVHQRGGTDHGPSVACATL